MPTANEPVAGWATDCRDKYPENHDSGYAGRICMADGAFAWAAVVSDGAGGSLEGLKVSALAVQAFAEAVRGSSLAELSDPVTRDAWLRAWTKKLHADAVARFKGGMATFCGAVLLPPAGEAADWKLFTLNVGDSQVWRLTGDGKCLGIVPDAPPNNANVEGRNPVRVVGVAPKGDFCLLDAEEFPLPAEGPCWILAGSDGFFAKKKGKDELSIFSSADMRDICLDPATPFQELPARAIRRSLANAQKLGCAEMMDNATVAMIGFRVPATDLGRPAALAGRVPPPAPPAVPPDRPLPAEPKPGGVAAPAGVPPAPKEREGLPRQPPPVASPPQDRIKPARTPPPAGSKDDRKRMLVVAASALFAGVVLGAVAAGGLSCRRSSPASAAAEPPEAPVLASAPSADAIERPKARCPDCWALFEKGLVAEKETLHWKDECPRR